MNQQGLVSVIITTYNYGKFLKLSLQSVFAQTFPESNREVIVIDDGSTDNTRQIVSDWKDKIHYLYQENSGQAAAINRAVEIAKGEILAFLDPDDEWYPEKLTRVVAEFENPEVGMVQHPMNIVENGRKLRAVLGKELSSGRMGEKVLTSQFRRMPTSALTIRKSVLQKIEPLPVVFRTAADLPLAIFSALMTTIRVINIPMGFYRIHESNSYADNTSVESLNEQLRMLEEIFRRTKSFTETHGIILETGSERYLQAEYPTSCRIDLAWRQNRILDLPNLYWQYLYQYAVPEYGFSLQMLGRSLRMGAQTLLPPTLFSAVRNLMRRTTF